MTLKFHNTLSSNIDEFVSLSPNKVLLYTCGPTVYDYAHIGNWASNIYWDTLVRVLMANNYEVDRVMNITDVGQMTSDADEGEDKLEKGAHREGKSAWEVAKFYTDDFMEGMIKLNMIRPKYIVKATDYIPDQLNLISKLKSKGYTYQINDGIYFDTSKFPTYADFAHLDLKSLKAGARVEYNQAKHNRSDFALWKFTPTGEKRYMEWETPAELLDYNQNNKPLMGFPGWHTECSAMALTLLGNTIDIHTGGIDHIQIHHTNEIAQSESATGVRFSNYWLHNNHLKVNGTKISKSLGNGYTLHDIIDKGYSPLDFRMFVLQGHYRNEGNFTFDALQAAKNRLMKWRNVAVLRHQIHDTIVSDAERNSDTKTIALDASSQAILKALDNDLSTPEALKIIDETFSHIINTSLTNINSQAFVSLLEMLDSTLGLQLLENTPDISDELKQLIITRNNAREQKDWIKADEIRKQLLNLKILLRDSDNNTIWEYTT